MVYHLEKSLLDVSLYNIKSLAGLW